jgi:uncharacterized protein YjdB
MRVFAGAVALLVAGPAAVVGQNVAEVQVAPPSVTLRVGERSGLLATAFDRAGNVIPTVRVLWSSNNIQVARVDNNGTVTGVATGVAIIEARVGSRIGNTAVQVVPAPAAPVAATPAPAPPPPAAPAPTPDAALAGQPPGTGPAAALRIEPPTIFLMPSENLRAALRALKGDGSAAAPVAATWKSLRPDIASVDEHGVVVALALGQGTIQVTSPDGLTATAPVVVQQTDFGFQEVGPVTIGPGEIDTLHIAVPTQAGRLVSPLALQWTSSDTSVARVSLTGVLTAAAPGKASVSVTGLLQSRAIDVVVHRPVELLAVRPHWQEEVVVPVQTTAKFEAQALGPDKNPVPEAPLRWSVLDTMVASFDPATGILTAKRDGRTQLVVKGPGLGLLVTWNIRALTANVKLSSSRLGLTIGHHAVVKGTYTDSAGASLGPAAPLAWTSDNPQVATVTEDGTVTAVGYGHAQITATAPSGKRTILDVFVQGELLVASSRSGKLELYAAERSNLGDLRRITEDTLTAAEPAVSPDGSRIAFTSMSEVYVMDADGKNVLRVSNSTGVDGHPQFTPDGNTVIYQSDRAGHPQVFVQQIGSATATQLTQEPAANTLPTVSPDGQTVAFVSTRDGGTNIWLMGPDGSNQRAFTKSAGTYRSTSPHFLQDGSLVYLVEGKENGRTVTQVVRADLPTGHVAALTGGDLLLTDFSVAPAGDVLALVVPVQSGGKSVFRVYLQIVGNASGPVPVPAGAGEQMLTPAFMP